MPGARVRVSETAVLKRSAPCSDRHGVIDSPQPSVSVPVGETETSTGWALTAMDGGERRSARRRKSR